LLETIKCSKIATRGGGDGGNGSGAGGGPRPWPTGTEKGSVGAK